jgi:hypothetical protein
LYSKEGQAFQSFFLSRTVKVKKKRKRESKYWTEKKKRIEENKSKFCFANFKIVHGDIVNNKND